MTTRWQWSMATPQQRGDWVRAHQHQTKNIDELCRLFSLNEDGAWAILNGAEWKPEYDASHDGVSEDGK